MSLHAKSGNGFFHETQEQNVKTGNLSLCKGGKVFIGHCKHCRQMRDQNKYPYPSRKAKEGKTNFKSSFERQPPSYNYLGKFNDEW